MAAQQVSYPAVMRLTDTLLKNKKSRHFRATTQQIMPETNSMDYSSIEEALSMQGMSNAGPRDEIKANISIYRTNHNGQKGRIFLGKTMFPGSGQATAMTRYGRLDTIHQS